MLVEYFGYGNMLALVKLQSICTQFTLMQDKTRKQLQLVRIPLILIRPSMVEHHKMRLFIFM